MLCVTKKIQRFVFFFYFFVYPASLQSWAVESALGITKGLSNGLSPIQTPLLYANIARLQEIGRLRFRLLPVRGDIQSSFLYFQRVFKDSQRGQTSALTCRDSCSLAYKQALRPHKEHNRDKQKQVLRL